MPGPPPNAESRSETLRIAAAGLAIVCERSGERFGHRIEWQPDAVRGGDPAAPVVLVSSLEGTADHIWPASPPLQDIHREERPGGVQLLLAVGRAGRSHWSLSCELDPRAGQATFDVACRVKSAPEFLGSTYTLDAACEFVPLPDGGGEIRAANGTSLQIVPLAGTRPTWDAKRHAFRLLPAAADDAQAVFPHTFRWQYALEAPRPTP